MGFVRKAVYVARDGREFDKEEDCRNWEQLLLTPEPVHLQDEHIVGLLSSAFPAAFYYAPKENQGHIVLKVKRRMEESGFDFCFTYNEGRQPRVFTGCVHGETSLMISQSYQVPGGYERSPDWNNFDSICLQDAYRYLDRIGYFTPRQEEEAPENPSLKKKDWQVIYEQDYSFTPAVLVTD